MSRKPLAAALLLALLATGRTLPVQAESPLTEEMMFAVLRPELPDDRDYLTYLAALLSNNDIPRHLVESTLLWAREKPRHKYRYFKRALIIRANDLGIKLPVANPETTGTIEGTVVYRFNLLLVKGEVPLIGAKVTIDGTDLSTVTNGKGQFFFEKVPFGAYRIHVEGRAMGSLRIGNARVTLPTRPPSDEPARPFIVAR